MKIRTPEQAIEQSWEIMEYLTLCTPDTLRELTNVKLNGRTVPIALSEAAERLLGYKTP